MSAPRDYRDPAEIDDALDAIRIAAREEARELYQSCLDLAYAQGRVDMMKELESRKDRA